MRLGVGVALLYSVAMRLFELALSHTNAERLDAEPVRDDGFAGIAAVQALWLAGMGLEEVRLGPRWGFQAWLFALFCAAELVRFWCIATLGMRWSVRVLKTQEPPVRRGLYRWFRHPNYAAVVAGMAALPLALGLVVTPLATVPLQLLALRKRVAAEVSCAGRAAR